MATSPIMSLMSDPAFAMFVEASGMQDELANADAARRRQSINQALGINTEDLEDQGAQERKNISGRNEASGIFKSGQNLEENAQSEKRQGRAQALAQLNAANQLGDVESGLLTGQANRQMDISQSALSALDRQLTQQGEDSIDDEVAGIGAAGLSPLTGIAGVGALGPEGQTAPGAPPIADVGISRRQAFNPTNKYKRAF